MNANDKKILVLKAQIKDKKALLSGSQSFSPVTNCSLELHGQRHNLHVLSAEQLTFLYVQLSSYFQTAADIGLDRKVIISGFSLESWITDIRSRLVQLTRKEEEAKLKAMEARLHSLLSTDTRVGIEIDEIEKEFK